MKKTWNVPSIETLDVRMTETGPIAHEREGTMLWINPDGSIEEEELFHPKS